MTEEIRTTSGVVRGRGDGAFLGIPYGTARRFGPLESVHWEGVLDCSRAAPACPQPGYLGKRPKGTEFFWLGKEGPLTLNVWTPPSGSGRGLPVVVFVHGGGFQVGSGSAPGCTGPSLGLEDGIVFVSMNYRLGVLGGLYLGEQLGEDYAGSGSRSAADVLAALIWVKENAQAFGADPDRITVLGVSAGAKILAALMTLPESRGLFAQAWLESGATQCLRSRMVAGKVTKGFLDLLPGVSAEDLRELPLERLLEAQAKMCDCAYSTCFFGPVLDDGMFSSQWLESWQRGEGWRGRAVLGSCRREMAEPVRDAEFFLRTDEILFGCLGQTGKERALKAAQRGIAGGGDPLEVWTAVYSDCMYRTHTDRLARRLVQQGSLVWEYSMEAWPAVHGMGMHHILYRGQKPPLPPAQIPLARILNRSVRAFVCCGDPGTEDLPRWEPSRPEAETKLYFDRIPSVHAGRGDTLEEVPEYNYCQGI